MTFRIEDLKALYEAGKEKGASHMIVVHDSIDHDQDVIYVMPGENPSAALKTYGEQNPGCDLVDECYNYKLGWESQSNERRALHWEWSPTVPVVESYPEHEKQSKILAQSQAQGEFLDWLGSKGIVLATWDADNLRNDRLTLSTRNAVDLLAEYHEIDLRKIEAERRQMLEKLRNPAG